MADAQQTVEQKPVQSVELAEATDSGTANAGSVDIILDVTMPITVSLGKTEIPVRRLLQLGPGAVLQLDKLIDEPVDLYVRDIRFAGGQVVVVDGRFAVRIENIVGAADSNAQPGQGKDSQQQK